jgi:uncharacterized membrane protein (UPF0127 family)
MAYAFRIKKHEAKNLLMDYFKKLLSFGTTSDCPAMVSRKLYMAVLLLLVVIPVQANACPLDLPSATITIEGHRLKVELAATPEARGCGLSNRFRLFADHGMLFIYPTSGPRTFWMKDTYIPLSIAFLDDNGRIISIQQMNPMQTDERYRSLQPVRYALEVNRGWFADHGIGIGNIVEMKLPAVIEIK